MTRRPTWTHEKSKAWRRKFIETVQDDLKLDPTILSTWGIITRIYDGQLIYEKGDTSLEWIPKEYELTHPRYNETPLVVKVKSQDPKITDPYTVVVILSVLSESEKLDDPMISPEDKHKIIYEITEAKDHSCRDEIYNIALKKIPTICKHKVAAIFDVQEGISRAIEEERLQDDVMIFKYYNPLPDEFKDFYNSLPKNLDAITRTRELYEFLISDKKVFNV